MITTKLFIGCHVPADLRIQLNQSAAWKQARVLPEDEQLGALMDITHQRRSYVGYMLPSDHVSIVHLKDVAVHLHAKLQSYCDAYPVETMSIYVFPQQLVS